jgi:hypothetical protein
MKEAVGSVRNPPSPILALNPAPQRTHYVANPAPNCAAPLLQIARPPYHATDQTQTGRTSGSRRTVIVEPAAAPSIVPTTTPQ